MRKIKTTVAGLIMSIIATANIASAQLGAPIAITGTYTADIGCVPIPNATVDAWLAAQAPYLKRGPTFTPAGTHPLCPLYLHYDQIVFGPNPPTSPNVDEVNHYLIDLEPVPGFACNNALGIPLPPGPVSFFPILHESSANFVAQAQLLFGYNAFLGVFARNHTPGATVITASSQIPGASLAFSAIFHTRTPIAGAGAANLAHMSAALNGPVFGNKTTGPSWSQVNWNAIPANASSQNAVMSMSSSYLPTPINLPNTAGINAAAGGFIHFEQVPFESTIFIDCL